MTATSDKELKQLLRESEIDPCLTLKADGEDSLVFAYDSDGETVRVLRKLHAGDSCTTSTVSKVLDSYDKARKGRVTT